MRSGKWFGAIRRKLRAGGSSSPTFIVLQTNSTTQSPSKELAPRASDTNETAFLLQDRTGIASSSPSTRKKDGGSKEDMAAAKIQALFRAHLARRAFQALRSLVKLQALVRGVLVRKQARMALHCMHALVRLQVTVRARQLLG